MAILIDALEMIKQAEEELKPYFSSIEETAFLNQKKVLQAFQNNRVNTAYFAASTGYGYGDAGRDALEAVYAEVFAGEDALVRTQIVSGTHAIWACLSALLRSGDRLLSAVGAPYDTLGNVIGKNQAIPGSLLERGVIYEEVALTMEHDVDICGLRRALASPVRMVLIQRSRGYALRPALTIEKIAELIAVIRELQPQAIVMVDNCYGEFVQTREPLEADADIMAGSLIKNPGGGLAPGGGYIAGKKELVEQVSYYVTAPGLGKELGASLGHNRLLYQGLFLAPHVVAQALEGVLLLACVFARHGYKVSPQWNEVRGDIVQAVCLNDASRVLEFAQVVQRYSPVDSFLQLEYAQTPGYTVPIVMAAGTFIQGSSIELSCDAPLREPYWVYFQGGLTYQHIRLVVEQLLATVCK